MTTLVVGMGYHAAALAFLLLCAGAGIPAFPVRFAKSAQSAIDWTVRAWLGFAMLSTWVVVLGLFGLLTFAVVWLPFVAFAMTGWAMAVRTGWRPSLRWVRTLRESTGALAAPHRIAVIVVAAVTGLLFLNILVGGLAPDNGQDSLWYHLTVPGQWILRGDVAMFPHNMPSTYTLGAEALYAALLLAGDEVLVTTVYAWVGIIGLAMFPLFAGRVAGTAAAAVAGAIACHLLALRCAVAPIGALNDLFASVGVLLAFWVLAEPFAEGESPTAADALRAGAIASFAVMAKVVAIGFVVPALGIAIAALAIRTRDARGGAVLALAAVAGAVAIALPWVVRGFMWSGNPILHVTRGVFELKQEFAPVLHGYEHEPARLYSLSPSGVAEALTLGLASKFKFAMTNLDGLVIVMPVAAVGALMTRTKAGTLSGAAVLASYAGLAMLRGYGEVVRYFSVAYPLCAPALGILCGILAARVRPNLLAAIALVFAAGTAATYWKGQLQWAGFPTIRWEFRPVLTAEAKREWLRHGEFGGSYLLFEDLQDIVPEDAVVLVADHKGPYYLRRRAYWADFSSVPILEKWWGDDTDAESAAGDLRERGIDYVLLLAERRGVPMLSLLAENGTLRPVRVPDDYRETRLWEVVE